MPFNTGHNRSKARDTECSVNMSTGIDSRHIMFNRRTPYYPSRLPFPPILGVITVGFDNIWGFTKDSPRFEYRYIQPECWTSGLQRDRYIYPILLTPLFSGESRYIDHDYTHLSSIL